jgi:hypothetical protein
VTSAAERTVDQGWAARYAQKKENRDFLINMTTILPVSGGVGLQTETFSRSAKVSRAAYGCQESQDGKIAA